MAELLDAYWRVLRQAKRDNLDPEAWKMGHKEWVKLRASPSYARHFNTTTPDARHLFGLPIEVQDINGAFLRTRSEKRPSVRVEM